MNIFQIECFLNLSKTLNFTQTSEEMYTSQPTLSRSIASLEQEIGAQLLLRNTKSVELTAAGRAFAKRAVAVIEQYEHGIEEAKKARDGVIGQIKIGLQHDAFEPFSVDLINLFKEEYPDIELNISMHSLSDLVQRLNNGKLDFIIAAGETTLKNPGRLLLNERQECAVLPISHNLAGRKTIKLEQLKDERFVAMSPMASTTGHYLLLKYANDARFKPNIVAMGNSVQSVMMLVACGVGVSVLYKELSLNAHGRLSFVPLEGVETFKRYLMWDKDNSNPSISSFISCAESISPIMEY